MSKGDCVKGLSNKIDSIVNEIAAAGKVVSELQGKLTFLRVLRNEFFILAQIIWTSSTNQIEAIALLNTYETNLEHCDEIENQAIGTFKRTVNNRNARKWFLCIKTGHIKRDRFSDPKIRNYKSERTHPQKNPDTNNMSSQDGVDLEKAQGLEILVTSQALVTNNSDTSFLNE